MLTMQSMPTSERARPVWPPADLPKVLPNLPGTPGVQVLDEQLGAIERELAGLRDELDLLRKRDQTLSFYMQRLDEELRLAAKLQQDFLPREFPAVGPMRFQALWRPAGYVSGDLYDVMRLDEEHVGFYIADAVGHGVPAALLTMFLRHSLVTKDITGNSYRLLDPAESLGRLNDALISQQLATGTFCTAMYGTVNTRTLEMKLSSAGHPAPLLLRAGESPRFLPAQGALLGIFEGERFNTLSETLRSGDRLVLYSDGLEVAFTDDHEGEGERWKQELSRLSDAPGEELMQAFTARLDGEAGSLQPRDDLTLLVVEVA